MKAFNHYPHDPISLKDFSPYFQFPLMLEEGFPQNNLYFSAKMLSILSYPPHPNTYHHQNHISKTKPYMFPPVQTNIITHTLS